MWLNQCWRITPHWTTLRQPSSILPECPPRIPGLGQLPQNATSTNNEPCKGSVVYLTTWPPVTNPQMRIWIPNCLRDHLDRLEGCPQPTEGLDMRTDPWYNLLQDSFNSYPNFYIHLLESLTMPGVLYFTPRTLYITPFAYLGLILSSRGGECNEHVTSHASQLYILRFLDYSYILRLLLYWLYVFALQRMDTCFGWMNCLSFTSTLHSFHPAQYYWFGRLALRCDLSRLFLSHLLHDQRLLPYSIKKCNQDLCYTLL